MLKHLQKTYKKVVFSILYGYIKSQKNGSFDKKISLSG